MPQIAELKKLTKLGEKQRLLREIKSVTVEKLTNKIVRAFAMEIAFIIPFLLIICMQYRQAALTDPTSQCYGDLARWLLTYFLGSGTLSLLRLLRAPVLRGLTHSFYFYFAISLVVLQLLFYIGMFFVGNSVFIAAWKP